MEPDRFVTPVWEDGLLHGVFMAGRASAFALVLKAECGIVSPEMQAVIEQDRNGQLRERAAEIHQVHGMEFCG